MVDLDRNGLEILGEAECWQLLEATRVGRLAVIAGSRPDVFPVNYVVDRGPGEPTIVFLTAPGTKLAGAVLTGVVAFEVDAADPLFHTGWSVVVHGTTQLLERTEDQMAAEELPLRPWGPSDKRDYVRIIPTEVTGRRILPAVAQPG
jgi:nitroimidazol reductase NimA-like FMN-containing flavoprotein (pyridoxamine 5'-phosphate oxidase superfamily)